MPKYAAFENFKKHWLEEIAKLEKISVDGDGTARVYNEFHIGSLSISHLMENEEFRELDNLEAKLTVALEIARSRYRTENPNWWDRLVESFGRIVHRIPRR